MTLSICMIVKNEEAVLRRCLESVTSFADEIVIADTGSGDSTPEIARAFTDKVYDFPWINDFSAARNFSFSKASTDYVMWLDADDVVPEATQEALASLKKKMDPSVDMVTMPYITHRDAHGNPVLTCMRERIIRRGKGVWREPVHEYIQIAGNVLFLNVPILHQKPPSNAASTRNLHIYEGRLARGETLSPRGTYYYARELRDHGRRDEAISWFEKFLDDGHGWGEDNIAACFALAMCHKGEGRFDRVIPSLLRAFAYDTPRADACCEIGYEYQRRKDWRRAAFWFELASSLDPTGIPGFVLEDYWGFIPNVELCVCWYHLGDLEKAEAHNERAALCKPNEPSIGHNRAFFAALRAG